VEFHEFLVSLPPMAEETALARNSAGEINGQRR
jgi:hypothetical protein